MQKDLSLFVSEIVALAIGLALVFALVGLGLLEIQMASALIPPPVQEVTP